MIQFFSEVGADVRKHNGFWCNVILLIYMCILKIILWCLSHLNLLSFITELFCGVLRALHTLRSLASTVPVGSWDMPLLFAA